MFGFNKKAPQSDFSVAGCRNSKLFSLSDIKIKPACHVLLERVTLSTAKIQCSVSCEGKDVPCNLIQNDVNSFTLQFKSLDVNKKATPNTSEKDSKINTIAIRSKVSTHRFTSRIPTEKSVSNENSTKVLAKRSRNRKIRIGMEVEEPPMKRSKGHENENHCEAAIRRLRPRATPTKRLDMALIRRPKGHESVPPCKVVAIRRPRPKAFPCENVELGQIVLFKMNGYCEWPATVTMIEGNLIHVRFFGDNTTYKGVIKNVFDFKRSLEIVIANLKAKKTPLYRKAVIEAETVLGIPQGLSITNGI